MSRHPNVVDITKRVCRLLLLAKREADVQDQVAVEFSLVSVNERITTVDYYPLVVVRD